MMRTYLVTVRGSKSGSPWFEPEAMAAFIGAGDAVKVEVVETTATHAKEREVVEAAMELERFSTDDIPDVSAVERRWSNLVGKVRELRALMEKKS